MKLTAEVAKSLRKFLFQKFPKPLGRDGFVISVRIDRSMLRYSGRPSLVVYCRQSHEKEIRATIEQYYGKNNLTPRIKDSHEWLAYNSFYVFTSTMIVPVDDYDDWAQTQIGKPLDEVKDPTGGRPENMVYLTDDQGKFIGHTTEKLFNKTTPFLKKQTEEFRS